MSANGWLGDKDFSPLSGFFVMLLFEILIVTNKFLNTVTNVPLTFSLKILDGLKVEVMFSPTLIEFFLK